MNNPVNYWCECCEDYKEFKLFDGYSFGDTLLEGVLFKLFPNGKVEPVDNWTQGYFKGLNYQYWLTKAHQYSADEDSSFICPDCRDSI